MGTIVSEKETVIHIDEEGNESISSVEKTRKYEKNSEPDYIKLYTKMWCEFNDIPTAYRGLFLELVTRMSYCTANDLKHSQLVNTGKPWSEEIKANLGWKDAMYSRGLKELCKCNAIRKVCRGVYQINPNYAGRGEWKYNPAHARGGVEDLVAKFRFSDKSIETDIIWADDGKNNKINKNFRAGLDVKADDGAILRSTTVTPVESEAS